MSEQNEPDSPEPADQDRLSRRRAAAKRPSVEAPAKPDRRPLLAAAAIGLVAGAVGGMAVAGLWHQTSGAPAKASGHHAAEAKKDVCTAALLARQAVAQNMHLRNPEPENPVAQLAVAANARLSLTGGAAYLRGRLDEDTAAPQDVLEAARSAAAALEHLNVSYLAGQSNSDREQLGHDLDARLADLGRLCQ